MKPDKARSTRSSAAILHYAPQHGFALPILDPHGACRRTRRLFKLLFERSKASPSSSRAESVLHRQKLRRMFDYLGQDFRHFCRQRRGY